MPLVSVTNKPPVPGFAEYLWLEGSKHCSRTRRVQVFFDKDEKAIPDLPRWHAGDNLLSPCQGTIDPLRPEPSYLVLCELRNRQDRCVSSRAQLRELLARGAHRAPIRLGFRQHYEDVSYQVLEKGIAAIVEADLSFHSSSFSPEESWIQVQPNEMIQNEILCLCDFLILARHLLMRIGLLQGILPRRTSMELLVSAEQGVLDELSPRLANPLVMPPHVPQDDPHPFARTVVLEDDPYLMAIHVLYALTGLERLDP